MTEPEILSTDEQVAAELYATFSEFGNLHRRYHRIEPGALRKRIRPTDYIVVGPCYDSRQTVHQNWSAVELENLLRERIKRKSEEDEGGPKRCKQIRRVSD